MLLGQREPLLDTGRALRALGLGHWGGLSNVAAGEAAEMRLKKGFSRRCGGSVGLAATQKFLNLIFLLLVTGIGTG